MWLRRDGHPPKKETGDFCRGFLGIFCCSLDNLNLEKLNKLEKFFEFNSSLFVYQDVIASPKRPIFTLKVFTKVRLDQITICLIEECFEVKAVITKVPKRDWLLASNVKFSPIKIDKFTDTSSFFAKSIKQDKFYLIIDASLAFGTGHHYTTKFCLQLIQDLKKKGSKPIKNNRCWMWDRNTFYSSSKVILFKDNCC